MAETIIATINPTIYVDNAKCVAAEFTKGKFSRHDWGDIYCLPELKKYFGNRENVVNYFYNAERGTIPLNPENDYYINNENPIQDWTYVADYSTHQYYNGNNEVKKYYIHARIDGKHKFEFAFFDKVVERKESNNRFIFNSFSNNDIDVNNKEEDNINHILRIGTKEEAEKIILTSDKSKIKVSSCPQYAGYIMNKSCGFKEVEDIPIEFTSYGHIWTYWYTIIDDVLYFCGFPLYIGNDKGHIKYEKNEVTNTLNLDIPPTDFDLEKTDSAFYKAINMVFNLSENDKNPKGVKAILAVENYGDYTEKTPISSRVLSKLNRDLIEQIQHGDISFSSSSFGYTKGGVYPIRGVPTVKNYDEVTFLSINDEIYRNKCIEETGMRPQEPPVANDGTPNTLYNMENAWCETGFFANVSKNVLSNTITNSNGSKTTTVDVYKCHNVSYIQTAIKNNSLTINIPLPMTVNFELSESFTYTDGDDVIIVKPPVVIEPGDDDNGGGGGLDVEYEETEDTGVPPPSPPIPIPPYNPTGNNDNNETPGNSNPIVPLKFLTLDFGRIRKDGKDAVVFVNYEDVYGADNPTTFPVVLLNPELTVTYEGLEYDNGYKNLEQDFWTNVPISQHVEPIIESSGHETPISIHVSGVLDLSGVQFFDTSTFHTYWVLLPNPTGEGDDFGYDYEIDESRFELHRMNYNYMIDKNSSSFIFTYKSDYNSDGVAPTSDNKEINATVRLEVSSVSSGDGVLITCPGADNDIVQNNGYFTNKIFYERVIDSGTYTGFLHSFTANMGKNSRAFFKARKHCVMARNDAVYSAIALGAKEIIDNEDLNQIASYAATGKATAEVWAESSNLPDKEIYPTGSATLKIENGSNIYYGTNPNGFDFSGTPQTSLNVKMKLAGDKIPLHLKSCGDGWNEINRQTKQICRYIYTLNQTTTFVQMSSRDYEKTITSK